MFEGYKKYITLTCWTLSAVCAYMAYSTGYTGEDLVQDMVLILNVIGSS